MKNDEFKDEHLIVTTQKRRLNSIVSVWIIQEKHIVKNTGPRLRREQLYEPESDRMHSDTVPQKHEADRVMESSGRVAGYMVLPLVSPHCLCGPLYWDRQRLCLAILHT